MIYRPDIDGLRALAVLSVIFYHMGIGVFSGGFVGVDVFFVISGYLITSIILPDIEAKNFSVVSFYDRRIRRIFPALFAVLGVSSVIAFLLFLPSDFKSYGKSLVATTVFASNMLFWRESGYFEGPAEEKPLLHTWSLSVEEQFYIFFPLLLVVIYRLVRRRYILFLGPLFGFSLALSIWAVSEAPDAAFYLAPMRAWELLLGALLALRVVPMPASTRLGEATSLVGLALIGWSAVMFTADTPFPGVSAMIPCLGTAMIIYSGATGGPVVTRLLSKKAVVFVGLISYPLYLWHWPLLVFAKYYLDAELEWEQNVALFAIMVLLATLSWQYIEKPFRGKQHILGRRALFATSAGVMSAVVGFGGIIVVMSGLPQRFPPKLNQIEALAQFETPDLDKKCFWTTPDKVRHDDLCKLGSDTSTGPEFILWGDSHGGALVSVLNASAMLEERAGVSAIYLSCPPLLGVTRHYTGSTYRCRDFNVEVLKYIAENQGISTVILVARWALSAEGERYRGEMKSTVYIGDDASSEISLAENKKVFKRGLERTVSELRKLGKRVLLVAQIPEVGFDVPRLLAKAYVNAGEWQQMPPTPRQYAERQEGVLAVFREMELKYGVKLVTIDELFCTVDSCGIEEDGLPLYSDDNHASRLGAARIVEKILLAFP